MPSKFQSYIPLIFQEMKTLFLKAHRIQSFKCLSLKPAPNMCTSDTLATILMVISHYFIKATFLFSNNFFTNMWFLSGTCFIQSYIYIPDWYTWLLTNHINDEIFFILHVQSYNYWIQFPDFVSSSSVIIIFN